jgi:hypothetical protein
MRDTAIRNTHHTVVSINAETEAWDKNGNEVELDEHKIQAEVLRLKQVYLDNQYQRDRASEYPSWQDQLDDIFHNGLESWKTGIQAVKDKYPKG